MYMYVDIYVYIHISTYIYIACDGDAALAGALYRWG